MTITNLSPLDTDLFQVVSEQEASQVNGGMINLGGVRRSPGLMSPDGEPVAVYVDGVLVNSVATGYYPG